MSSQAYIGTNTNKPVYFGDAKELKKKRGMELLQTEEDEDGQGASNYFTAVAADTSSYSTTSAAQATSSFAY